MTQEALRMALDFVETVHVGEWVGSIERQLEVITAIKEALAKEKTLQAFHSENERLGLYKDAYAERTWVGLAAEDRLTAKYMQDAPDGIEAVIDYIEAKLKDRNDHSI